MTTQFQVGDKVIDRDGYLGTIRKITKWRGSRWYDVRFSSGEAVRYDNDLQTANPGIGLTYAQTGGEC
jgi:hypothetical protein